jgi:hypothetical protein
MFDRVKKFGLAAIVILLVFVFMAPQAFAAYRVKQVIARISGTAGETVTTGQLVAPLDSDGEWYKANAGTATIRPAIGVVGSKTGGDGETIEIVLVGILTGWTSLAEGDPGYLSETSGAVTQSTPSYSQQVGIALSATDYYFDFQNYFDSSAVTALGVLSGASPIVMEGATADAYETTIGPVDPTADRSITYPDRSGQVKLSSAASVLTPSTAVTLTVGLSNVYTDTPTDNENQTITFSGAGTAGDEITIIFTTVGTADEVITFHATLVSSEGTLTCDTTAARYYVVRFISNGTHWFEVSRTAVQV